MGCLDFELTSVSGMEYWLLSTVDDKGNKATTGGMMKRPIATTARNHKLF